MQHIQVQKDLTMVYLAYFIWEQRTDRQGGKFNQFFAGVRNSIVGPMDKGAYSGNSLHLKSFGWLTCTISSCLDFCGARRKTR